MVALKNIVDKALRPFYLIFSFLRNFNPTNSGFIYHKQQNL